MQEFIKMAIENSKEAIVIISNHCNKNKEPTIAYANEEFIDKIGYDLDELINQSPNKFFHLHNNQTFTSELLNETRKSKTWASPLILQNKNKNNSILYFNIVPIFNISSQILYYACFGHDIDNDHKTVKRTNIASKHLNNFINAVFDQTDYFSDISNQIPTGMWRIDSDLNIVYSNNTAINKFGFIPDTNFLEHVQRSEHRYIKNMFKSCSKNQLISKMSFRLKTNEIATWVRCDYWPIIKDKEITGYTGTIQDITNEQILVKQLQILKAN